MRRLVFALLALLIVPPLLYVGAAFGLSMATSRAPLPTDGILVFACDNGVHTDLVMPVDAGGVDWRTLFRQQHFIAPVGALDHIGLGWGSRNF